MEKYNWFDFKGTISGWKTIARNFVAMLFLLPANALGDSAGLALLLLIPYFWLAISTFWKRAKAFTSKPWGFIFPALADAPEHDNNG